MAQISSPSPNRFVRVVRKVYNPLGFSKGYNFVLWFIFAGALFGFTLARLQYLSIDGVFCARGHNGSNQAAPGECFYYQHGSERIGIILHLATILPVGILVVFQFIPAIRYNYITLHRINGYVVIVLALISNASVLMVARHAFNGTLATQSWVGLAVIMTVFALGMGYYNIKRLQIDQHRKWMIRAWFYFAQIVTLRIIMIISAQVVTTLGTYYLIQPCDKLRYIYDNNNTALLNAYPECSVAARTIVHCNFKGNAAELASAMNISFGMAGWLAFALHAFGVEIYFNLTPRESERLKDVSYERQVQAGFKHPGNAGLTAEKLGDANPYEPKTRMQQGSMSSTIQEEEGLPVARSPKFVSPED